MQKVSLAERTREAEARAQQAGAAVLNMRQMYEQAIQEKLQVQQRLSQMETFIGALAIEYGNRGEIEISASAIAELSSVEGFSFEPGENGSVTVVLFYADESEDSPDEPTDDEE